MVVYRMRLDSILDGARKIGLTRMKTGTPPTRRNGKKKLNRQRKLQVFKRWS